MFSFDGIISRKIDILASGSMYAMGTSLVQKFKLLSLKEEQKYDDAKSEYGDY